MPPDITFFLSFGESADTPLIRVEFLILLICQATNISYLYVLNGDLLGKSWLNYYIVFLPPCITHQKY
ncbi:hypothetical protein EX404_01840 [Salmonella enterica]|nr:hypothetical protein [Salmonella enterica]EAW1161378.1 hypothetical protein [Salmonella enterica subsp. enterica]EAW1320242.1 hypothetical protein [Salmonella enterica subsp. diarizonae]ECF6854949.1 hypothetical protein [Salmonella enterica subsp. arizonae]EAN5692188.1 hypothetical protein [Salmonella enterica]